MLFRTLDGKIVELNRKDFLSCKEYYSKINLAIFKKDNISVKTNETNCMLEIINNK